MKLCIIVAFACALLLGAACLHMPLGYYAFLRWAVCIGAACIMWNIYKEGMNSFFAFMFIIAIMFNPIAPIYLHSKDAWMPIDLIAAALFVAYGVIALRRHY